MPRPRKYPEELVQRGVRLVFDSGRPVTQVAADLGIGPETLRKACRQAEADVGKRGDLLTSSEREEIKQLRRENQQLRRAKEGTTHYPRRRISRASAHRALAPPASRSLA
jgi:transposase